MRYLDDENEEPDDEPSYNEHLRFSSSSYHAQSEASSDNALREENKHNASSSRYSGGSNYNHNKRMSRTSRHSANTRDSYQHDNRRSQASAKTDDAADTIALFGAYGITGHYFLKFALEAGYNVRVLLLPGIVLDDMEGNDKLTVITGAFDDEQKVRRVVRKASYVVCMLNDCDHTLQNSIPPSNFDFIQRLLPILNEYQKCKVLLYQVRRFACQQRKGHET
jgi:hypothetical protein